MEAVKTNEPTDNYKEADISINGQETETNLYFNVTHLTYVLTSCFLFVLGFVKNSLQCLSLLNLLHNSRGDSRYLCEKNL